MKNDNCVSSYLKQKSISTKYKLPDLRARLNTFRSYSTA